MKVFVYFNLHKKVFSIKALEGEHKGRVIAHRRQLMLYNAVFKVSEAGRQRVLRECRKNVHAGIVGNWINELINVDNRTQVTYNPYKYDSFVIKGSEEPIRQAASVRLVDRAIFV